MAPKKSPALTTISYPAHPPYVSYNRLNSLKRGFIVGDNVGDSYRVFFKGDARRLDYSLCRIMAARCCLANFQGFGRLR